MFDGKKGSFLAKYKGTELDIFQDMLEKMVSSKSAEIYRQAKLRKELPPEDVSSESSLQESMKNASIHEVDSNKEISEISAELKKIRKLKPSGIVVNIIVDPDEDSDLETIKSRSVKNVNSAIDVNAKDEEKKKKLEMLKAKKAKEK